MDKQEKTMRLLIVWVLMGMAGTVSAETWVCQHTNQEREALTFMVSDEASVRWEHARLGAMDPLQKVVNSDSILTMATQRVTVMYSRFFHLDKFSGRMGETTFRTATLRRLAEGDPELNWDMVTTVWQCELQSESAG
jgi:hypothetical protein